MSLTDNPTSNHSSPSNAIIHQDVIINLSDGDNNAINDRIWYKSDKKSIR